MTLFLWNILLMLVYIAVSSNYSLASFGVGFAIGYFVLWATQREKKAKYFSGFRRAIAFVLTFVWELLLSNFRIAVDVLRWHPPLRPGIFAYPLEAQTDGEITLLANIITLTPGTLSLDVSTDRKTLYIHGMYLEDPEAARQSIREGFERRVLELLR